MRKKERAVWNQRPTLQGQITALRRQVNNTKPETQYFRVSGGHTSGGTLLETVHHDVTSSLIASLSFRDLITGDQWKNHFIKFRIHGLPENKLFRVVVYVPKKSGTLFAPSVQQYVSIPDPSSFWVLHDRTYTDKDTAADAHAQLHLSLKGLKTIYDSNAAVINKGEVIITVISTATTTSTLQYTYAYELGFSNL